MDKTALAILYKKFRIGRVIIYGNKIKHIKNDFYKCIDELFLSVLQIIITPFRLLKIIYDLLPKIRICTEDINTIKELENIHIQKVKELEKSGILKKFKKEK